MPFVAAKCPACGANIQVPSEGEKCFCAYCGTQILREAAVSFAKVQVEGVVETRSADFDIQAGVLKGYHGSSADVVVPDNVTYLDENAFANLPIRSIAIPETIKLVPGAINAMPTLESITIKGGPTAIHPEGNMGYLRWGKCTLYPRGRTAQEATLDSKADEISIVDQPFLRKAVIAACDDGTSTATFKNCGALEEVVLPQKGIMKIVVDGCSVFKRLVIPQDTKGLSVVVRGCRAIEELDVSMGVNSLSVTGCGALTMLKVAAPLETVDINSCDSLPGVNGTTCFQFPAGTKRIGVCVNNEAATIKRQLIIHPGCVYIQVHIPNLSYVEFKEGFTELGTGGYMIGSLHGWGYVKNAKIVLPRSLTKVGDNNLSGIDAGTCTLVWPNLETAQLDFHPNQPNTNGMYNFRTKYWRSQGRCPHCGGRIGGLRTKRCTSCGKEFK